MLEIADVATEAGTHERICLIRDPDAGLTAVIAIHSTALGPAMGGVRHRAYRSIDDAIADARRLSAAMTQKTAAADLPLGGGKAVIVATAPEPSDAVLDSFAGAVDALGGLYVAAEDIGTTPRHMDRIARTTRYVAGRSTSAGGSGDPSPATARTVFAAMRAAASLRWGDSALRGRRVGVLGVGKVGAALAGHAARAGAQLVIADVDATRAAAVAARHRGATVVAVDTLPTSPLDVLAPCATGGLIGPATIPALRCAIVCGAANNILVNDLTADALAGAGILYVPDFIANAGGIIQVGGEYLGWTKPTVERYLAAAEARTVSVLEDAARENSPPLRSATALVARRLASARRSCDAVASDGA